MSKSAKLPKTTKVSAQASRPIHLSKAHLAAMVEESLVDAYDDDEQRVGIYTMVEDHLKLPFETEVLGVPVTVERVDLTPGGAIVAICARGNKRQQIPILDLTLPSPVPEGAEWIEAYRYWVEGS